MPICIAGMHRSGTSLVARLLQAAGLHLGAEADMMPPQPDNPEGFWENIQFTDLNDAILARAGGRWDRPPTLDEGWERDARFDSLFERATTLIETFAGREPWGWKDPRNSLTLPFWRRLLPDLRVVLCLRNPLEVAQSLLARNKIDIDAGVRLWTTYLRRAANAIPPERRLVTHFESWFLDFDAEARRVIEFAGLRSGDLDALKVVNEDLRHNRRPMREFVDGRLPRDVMALYFDLAAEAGQSFRSSHGNQLLAAVDEPASAVGDPATRALGRFVLRGLDRDREIQSLHTELERATAALLLARQQRDAIAGHAAGLEYELAILREQRTWRRYQWADWLASRWYHIKRRFRK